MDATAVALRRSERAEPDDPLHEPGERRQEHGAAVSGETRLSLLGGFSLVHDGVVRIPAVHGQRLLAYLALFEQASRSLVAGTLWPDVGEQRALGNLRSTLWRLQHTCPAVVLSGRNLLGLAPSVSVDVHRLRSETSYLASRPVDPGTAELAQGSLCGELLPGWYEDWILTERDRLQHLRLRALEEAADVLLQRGRYVEALNAALAVVRTDPLRESARRLILRVHLAEGDRVEALRHFRAYRVLLAAELGIEPSPSTRALLQPPS